MILKEALRENNPVSGMPQAMLPGHINTAALLSFHWTRLQPDMRSIPSAAAKTFNDEWSWGAFAPGLSLGCAIRYVLETKPGEKGGEYAIII